MSHDDVSARLAAKVTQLGFCVIRANTAFEAVKCYAKHPFAMVIADIHLPDTRGWLMAAKLLFVDPTARIWLYESRSSHAEVTKAQFLQVDGLIVDGGDRHVPLGSHPQRTGDFQPAPNREGSDGSVWCPNSPRSRWRAND